MKHLFVIYLCLVLAVVAVTSRRQQNLKGDAKIVGGKNVDITSVPYQVSVQKSGEHYCGGSIINEKYVLTAAHCVDIGKAKDYSVRVGSNYHSSGGQIIQISKIAIHPDYSSSSADYDVAVVEMAEAISENSKAKPVPLAENEPKTGESVLVSGWGHTQQGGKSSKRLNGVTLPVIDKKVCKSAYVNFNTVTENMFCAGYMAGGKDACQGDSGGPAVTNGKQSGIVSWGSGCARPNRPGVYTSVAKVRSWILKQTK